MNSSQLSATRPEADNNNLKLITRKRKMLVGTRPCFLRQNDYGFAHFQYVQEVYMSTMDGRIYPYEKSFQRILQSRRSLFFEINVDYFLNLS